MSELIKLQGFKYVMDWYSEFDVEIDIDEWSYFQLQCRGGNGDWYLMHHKWDGKEWAKCYHNDFNLNGLRGAAQAFIKLGSKIKKIDHLHASSIVKELKSLMNMVDKLEQGVNK